MDHDLASGGAALFESLSETGDSAELSALILEAARIKDRLDGLVRGEEELWARLVTARGGDDAVLEVKIDSALTEARQQATVFRQMLTDIGRQRSQGNGGAPMGMTLSTISSEDTTCSSSQPRATHQRTRVPRPYLGRGALLASGQGMFTMNRCAVTSSSGAYERGSTSWCSNSTRIRRSPPYAGSRATVTFLTFTARVNVLPLSVIVSTSSSGAGSVSRSVNRLIGPRQMRISLGLKLGNTIYVSLLPV
ncbi:hypothetical protein [Nocardia sp. NPDC004711]